MESVVSSSYPHTRMLVAAQRCSWPLTALSFISAAFLEYRIYVDRSFDLASEEDDLDLTGNMVHWSQETSGGMSRYDLEFRAMIPAWCPVMIESSALVGDVHVESRRDVDYYDSSIYAPYVDVSDRARPW
jgi:hypothetical protein